jgi:hypothetical protein
MSSAFERMQKLAEQKKKAQLELVPVPDGGIPQSEKIVDRIANNAVDQDKLNNVDQNLENAVNHADPSTFTTNISAVNNLTTEKENVNLFTTKKGEGGKQSNKITTNENVVNHQKRDWSTTDRKRGKYGETVESFRTSEDFKQKIKVFCAENKIDKQDFYRIVVNHYFETVVNQAQENAVNLLTIDDLRLKTLYKTKALIINLYLQYNSIFNEKTKWTVRDDDAGQSVNDLDIQVIELGIIQTQANKRFEGKINSFSYYLPEIRNFAELNLSGEILQAMLDVNRRRWQQQTGRTVDLDFLNE